MSRYIIDQSTWWTYKDVDCFEGITIEVADLIEQPSGRRWAEGAVRVRSKGHRTRTFKGETAWHQAHRHAGDLFWKRVLG